VPKVFQTGEVCESRFVGIATNTASNTPTVEDFGVSMPNIHTETADAVHGEVIEDPLTEREIKRILLAVLAGKSDGGGTTTVTFQDYADAKARVTATVNSAGNRTAISLDGS
jgi:hypothetical protein